MSIGPRVLRRAERILLLLVLATQVAGLVMIGKLTTAVKAGTGAVREALARAEPVTPDEALDPEAALLAALSGPDATLGAADRIPKALRLDAIPMAARHPVHRDWMGLVDRAFEDFGRLGGLHGLDAHWTVPAVTAAMDMREADDRYLVVVSLPGVVPDDVSVVLHGQLLSVAGYQSGSGGWRRHFERRIRMPEPVAPESVRASFSNGVLRVEAPKESGGRMRATESDKPARIM